MRIQLPKKHLVDILSHIERIVPSKSSTTNLTLIHIHSFEDNLLCFQGSNMDMDIEAVISTDITGEGHFAVPANVFGQVIKALPGELVTLERHEQELAIHSGTFDTTLQLVEASNVPELIFPETYVGSLEAQDIITALEHVRYATAVAEYQAVFRGIKLELQDNRTRAVATDGFRLAYYHTEVSSGLDNNIILPAKAVDELIRLLSAGETKLHYDSNQLSLASGIYKLNIKLMEGSFPDYERVIPQAFVVSMTVDSKQLVSTIRRVALMADEQTNNRVDLVLQDGILQVTAEGNYGHAQESLTVSQEGQESQIALAYNAGYLIDALAPMKGNVRISFSGPTSPSVLESLQDSNYLAMVVPLRIGS